MIQHHLIWIFVVIFYSCQLISIGNGAFVWNGSEWVWNENATSQNYTDYDDEDSYWDGSGSEMNNVTDCNCNRDGKYFLDLRLRVEN